MKIKDIIENERENKKILEIQKAENERILFEREKEELKKKSVEIELEKENIKNELSNLEKIRKENISRPYISNSWDQLITMLDQWRVILSGSLNDKDRDLYAQKINDIEKELKLRDYNLKK